MKLNISKTKARIAVDLITRLIVDSIETVDSTKLLSVLISDDIKRNTRIDTICK